MDTDETGYECTCGSWHDGIEACPTQGRTDREVEHDESFVECTAHGRWFHREADCPECASE